MEHLDLVLISKTAKYFDNFFSNFGLFSMAKFGRLLVVVPEDGQVFAEVSRLLVDRCDGALEAGQVLDNKTVGNISPVDIVLGAKKKRISVIINLSTVFLSSFTQTRRAVLKNVGCTVV